MSLKAILFNFNGIVIQDDPIRKQLIENILLRENLRFDATEYQQLCQGKSDRHCLDTLLKIKGRVVKEDYLNKLLNIKAREYEKIIIEAEKLPIAPDFQSFYPQIQSQNLQIAAVTTSSVTETELVLTKADMTKIFASLVSADECTQDKPEPDCYLKAISKLELNPEECLVIENSLVGIAAAKKAKIPVVGLANFYPLHILQRQADWIIDTLTELELDRVCANYG